jgi:hypothetical protein
MLDTFVNVLRLESSLVSFAMLLLQVSFIKASPLDLSCVCALSVVFLRARGDAVNGESPWDLLPTRGENFSKLSLDRERGAGSKSVFSIGELQLCFFSISGGMLL